MTIQQKLESDLVDHGLWPDEAKAVIEELKIELQSKPMRNRWGEDETAFPASLLAVLFLSSRRKAVEWIEKNQPMHSAKFILLPQEVKVTAV